MSSRKCAVYRCKNNLKATKNRRKNVKYYNFPSENDTRRSVWIESCNRPKKFDPDNSSICSDHFSEDSYENNQKNELTGTCSGNFLKSTAVPTLNLPTQNDKENVELPICNATTPSPDLTNNENIEISTDSDNDPSDVEAREKLYRRKYKILFEKYKEMKNTYVRVKHTKMRRMRHLNKMINYYKKKTEMTEEEIAKMTRKTFFNDKNRIVMRVERK